MGLDMNLCKRHTFWRQKITQPLNIIGHLSIIPERIRYIDEEIFYWRKANHIHGWFVRISEREDDCNEIEVSTEQLKELKSLCEQVLVEPAKAPELLPTQEGFFFGSTEYDENYRDDTKQTLEMLTRELSTDTLLGEEFYWIYQASW